jgi:hypothetical protein
MPHSVSHAACACMFACMRPRVRARVFAWVSGWVGGWARPLSTSPCMPPSLPPASLDSARAQSRHVTDGTVVLTLSSGQDALHEGRLAALQWLRVQANSLGQAACDSLRRLLFHLPPARRSPLSQPRSQSPRFQPAESAGPPLVFELECD